MTVLSLFDGMSCGQQALAKCGIEVDKYYASEVDKYAISVTQHNYPDTIQLGDVTRLDIDKLPKIDLLIGGSPCQGFSFAGKMKGSSTVDNIEITTLTQYLKYKGYDFEGQSYLFWEYIYILKLLQPKYFLLENVKMSAKWQDMFNKAVGVKPIEINSSLMSAQNRKRLYWTNIPDVTIPKDKGILLKDIIDYSVEPIDNIKNCVKKNVVAQYDDIATSTKMIHQLKCDSGWQDNKVGITKSPTLRAGNSFCLARDKDLVVRKLSVIECERLQTVADNYTAIGQNGETISNTQRYKMIGNGWTVDVIAHIMKGLRYVI